VSKEIASLADRLNVGQCSLPLHTSLGYFLVRLVKAVPTREISFKEAHLRLVYLATRDKFLDMDSLVDALAKKYYSANIAQFRLPDTMAIRAWLLPRSESRQSGMVDHKGRKPVVVDTARFKSMEISSLALTSELRIALQGRVRQDSTTNFFGPLSDRNGRWYFQVRSRKPAIGVLPFRLVRKDILDRMTALHTEQGSGVASDEAQNEVGVNLALARAIKQEQYRKQKEEMEATRSSRGDTGRVPQDRAFAPGQMQSIEAASVRMYAEEAKQRAEEARMLKEARVDLNRLFR
jgi:hypothetical protein